MRRKGPRPRAPEVLAPVLQLTNAWQLVLSATSLMEQCQADPTSCVALPLNRR
jgi:hypothetical protein